jgi:hypothetical protein
MADRDRGRVPDGRQVDRFVPRKEQAGVAGDDRSGAWTEAEP